MSKSDPPAGETRPSVESTEGEARALAPVYRRLYELGKEAEERERTIAEERRLAKEANDKLEAIAKAKAAEDAKVEAERKRIASEEAKAAKAPIKTKMSVWVNSFALPDCPVENELSSEIIQKFESFKNWSLNQINNA